MLDRLAKVGQKKVGCLKSREAAIARGILDQEIIQLVN